MSAVLVSIPLKTVSEANSHAHWRKRSSRVSGQHLVVLAYLRGHRPPPLPAVVILTRCAPRELDTDNLATSLKHVRDAVAKWIEVDDRDPRVTWHVAQAKARTGAEAVLVCARARDERDDEFDRARDPGRSVRTRATPASIHLRHAVLAELSRGEATSLELSTRLLGSATRLDASRIGAAAASLASRGALVRLQRGGWRITPTGTAALRELTTRARPTPARRAAALDRRNGTTS